MYDIFLPETKLWKGKCRNWSKIKCPKRKGVYLLILRSKPRWTRYLFIYLFIYLQCHFHAILNWSMDLLLKSSLLKGLAMSPRLSPGSCLCCLSIDPRVGEGWMRMVLRWWWGDNEGWLVMREWGYLSLGLFYIGREHVLCCRIWIDLAHGHTDQWTDIYMVIWWLIEEISCNLSFIFSVRLFQWTKLLPSVPLN